MEPEDRARLVHDQQRFEQLVKDAFRSVHGIWPFVSSIGVFSHVLSCACVCSRVRARPLVCERVLSCACVCRRVQACALMCVRVPPRARVCSHVRACALMCVCVCRRVSECAVMCVCVPPRARVCSRVRAYAVVCERVHSCACVCSRSRACAPMRVRVAPFACESVHSYACVCRRVRECAVVCFVFSETTHTPSPMGKMFHHPLDAKEQEIFKEMQVNWKNLYRMNLYQKKRKTGRCASGRWPPV